MRKTKSIIALWLLLMILSVPGISGAAGVPDQLNNILSQLGEIQNKLNDTQNKISNLPPIWSRQLPANERFVVLSDFNNEAVLDNETGLVWEQSPSADPEFWDFAPITCYQKNIGNRKGWRLPSVQELSSLIDSSIPFPGPTLPSGHPFSNVKTSNGGYWSTTPYHANPVVEALYVSFAAGTSTLSGRNALIHSVWCVRSGQSNDTQAAPQ